MNGEINDGGLPKFLSHETVSAVRAMGLGVGTFDGDALKRESDCERAVSFLNERLRGAQDALQRTRQTLARVRKKCSNYRYKLKTARDHAQCVTEQRDALRERLNASLDEQRRMAVELRRMRKTIDGLDAMAVRAMAEGAACDTGRAEKPIEKRRNKGK